MKNRQAKHGKRTLWGSIALASASILVLSGCTAAGSGNTVEAGELACASSGEYPPFSYRDNSNNLIGFDIEVCEAIAAELGLKAVPVTGAFNTLIAGLTSGRFDTIIGSMTATDERREQVDFTRNYYENGAVLFVNDASMLTGPADLNDAVVGVALGTWFEDLARSLDGVAEVRTYQADIDALNDVANGRIDAAITVRLGGFYAANESGLAIKAVGGDIAADSAAIAVGKDNPELFAEISAALDTILSNGVYAEISNRYFGQDISQ
jgi:polar amino acid transport system substrate-binding protein